MSLYRLDFANGTPVRDTVMGGDFLTTNAQSAREHARREARESGSAVIVTRIYGAGQMRHHYTATPTTQR